MNFCRQRRLKKKISSLRNFFGFLFTFFASLKKSGKLKKLEISYSKNPISLICHFLGNIKVRKEEIFFGFLFTFFASLKKSGKLKKLEISYSKNPISLICHFLGNIKVRKDKTFLSLRCRQLFIIKNKKIKKI